MFVIGALTGVVVIVVLSVPLVLVAVLSVLWWGSVDFAGPVFSLRGPMDLRTAARCRSLRSEPPPVRAPRALIRGAVVGKKGWQ
jgi:hypothetical protein